MNSVRSMEGTADSDGDSTGGGGVKCGGWRDLVEL